MVEYGTGTVSSVFFFYLINGPYGTEASPVTMDIAYVTVLKPENGTGGLNTTTGA